MKPAQTERLISRIYEAAIDGRSWSSALTCLAETTGCVQVSLDIYDRASGLLTQGMNPLIRLEYADSYRHHWLDRFSFWKRMASVPVGRTLRSADLFDDAFWKSAFYQEWSRPQGVGTHGRYANVASAHGAFAMLRAVKPAGSADFTAKEHRLFEFSVQHLSRALQIHRRLRLADAQQSAPAYGAAPAGFLLVDGRGQVLAAHEPTHERLRSAGLLSYCDDLGHAEVDSPTLKRLLSGATASSPAAPKAGQVEHRGRDGRLLRINVVPLSWGGAPQEPWLAIDRPAALLLIAAPDDAIKERVARLAAEHALTPAEAAVAVEAAKGDGRAAVAARLGIRETTVRSHLSTIFDKLGIHRQAELSRIVADN